jgi:hypothetical protein
MRLIKFLLLSIFFTTVASFSQATTNGSTLTITDIAGNNIYWEYNFSSTGSPLGQSGPGVPLNTPLRFKLSSSSGALPKFVAGDLNGNCDSLQVGSMNSTNTQFTTTLKSCCPSTVEIRTAEGGIIRFDVKCATLTGGGGTGINCITYSTCTSFNTCIQSNVFCISFFLSSTTPTCITKNYTVVVGFTDGSSTTIIVNFGLNNTVFCFAKPISKILSSNFATCNCGDDLLLKQIKSDKKTGEINVIPNPTSSKIKFTGENLENYKISLFDISGKEMIHDLGINNEVSIENQAKGVYIYVIEGENGFRQEGKIIKE